jgi:hypothetical protein
VVAIRNARGAIQTASEVAAVVMKTADLVAMKTADLVAMKTADLVATKTKSSGGARRGIDSVVLRKAPREEAVPAGRTAFGGMRRVCCGVTTAAAMVHWNAMNGVKCASGMLPRMRTKTPSSR